VVFCLEFVEAIGEICVDAEEFCIESVSIGCDTVTGEIWDGVCVTVVP